MGTLGVCMSVCVWGGQRGALVGQVGCKVGDGGGKGGGADTSWDGTGPHHAPLRCQRREAPFGEAELAITPCPVQFDRDWAGEGVQSNEITHKRAGSSGCAVLG